MKVEVVPKNELVKIEKENKPVVSKAQAFVVKVSDDETKAYDILRQIKERINLIEEKRTSITKPLNASLKAANTLFKQLSDPLKEADSIIRQKILAFRQKQEEIAVRKQEQLCEKANAALEAGDEAKAEKLQAKAENITANVGNSLVQKRWTYEIVDIRKIPYKYLTVDSPIITQDIKAGERDIPGLRIFQEESIRII